MIRGGDESVLSSLGITRRESVPVDELLARYLSERDPRVMWVSEGIHRDRNNEEAWDTICGHPDVTVTIDLFHEGWVFYREGMEKQDFVVRRQIRR